MNERDTGVEPASQAWEDSRMFWQRPNALILRIIE